MKVDWVSAASSPCTLRNSQCQCEVVLACADLNPENPSRPGGGSGVQHEGLALELLAQHGDHFAGGRRAQLLGTDAIHALHLP